METLYYWEWQSPIGLVMLMASDRGLLALEFGSAGPRTRKGEITWIRSEEQLMPYRAELEEYFAGRRRHFDLPLDLRGTDFQKRCWRALLDIPYGETRTYAQIARAVGRPQAFRAVGMANHSNPVAIVVPCHRVIASNGSLCGYGGGLDLKARLLELERNNLRIDELRPGQDP